MNKKRMVGLPREAGKEQAAAGSTTFPASAPPTTSTQDGKIQTTLYMPAASPYDRDVVKVYKRKGEQGKESRYYLRYWFEGKPYTVYSDLGSNALASKKTALKLAAAIDVEIANGEHSPARYQPSEKNAYAFSAMAARWVASMEKRVEEDRLSINTLRKFSAYVRNYYAPHFGSRDITEFRKADITSLLDALPDLRRAVHERELASGRKRNAEKEITITPKGRRDVVDCLKTFFLWAKSEEIIPATAVPQFPGRKELPLPEKAPVWTTIENQLKVVRHTQAKFRGFIFFNCMLGFRNGETITIRVGDVSIADRHKGNIRVHHHKTGVEHWVALPSQVVPLVRHMMKGKHPAAPLFTYQDKSGKEHTYTVQYLYRITKAALQEAELEHMTPYQLFKHSVHTQLAKAGVSEDVRVAYGGWKDRRMARKYTDTSVIPTESVREARVFALKKSRGTVSEPYLTSKIRTHGGNKQ